MGMNELSAEYTVKQMKEKWGGSLPDWEDYKKTYRDGEIKVDKTVAAKAMAIKMCGIPKGYFILYGAVTLQFANLLFLVTLAAWFFMDFSAWWILWSLLASWFIIAVCRAGHCRGIMEGAARNKEFYEIFVSNGAFIFDPDTQDR